MVLGAVPLLSQAPGGRLQLVRRAHYVMGTVFEIEAYGEDADRAAEAVEEAFAAIRRADEMMSNYREESDLSRLNREGAGGFIPVPRDLYELLQKSVEYSRLTDSAFDVTVGPLVVAWQRASEQGRLPSDRERTQLLPLIGSGHLLFAEEGQAVRLDRPGVTVDLGGIAKGWAVDRAAQILRQHGIERALISSGTSSVYAMGSPPGQPAWNIAVRHPLREDEMLAVVSLRDQSLSTSASYEKHLRIGGRTYSHILDPRSAAPVGSMWSSTVIAPDAVESDALSTATFVLGLERAERLLRKLGRPAVLVGKGNRRSEITIREIASTGGMPVIHLQRRREKQ